MKILVKSKISIIPSLTIKSLTGNSKYYYADDRHYSCEYLMIRFILKKML